MRRSDMACQIREDDKLRPVSRGNCRFRRGMCFIRPEPRNNFTFTLIIKQAASGKEVGGIC